MTGENSHIASFVAVGDSFTEGMNDLTPGGELVGWADRLAGMLATGDPGFQYANLAVRGKLLRQIVSDQVPRAIEMLAGIFDAAVARLRNAGLRVIVVTGFDPLAFPLIALLRGKVGIFNMHLRAIADARGCDLVDLWGMRSLTLPAAWSPDRLHLNSSSHRLIAERAAEVLGVRPAAALAGPGRDAPPLAWSPPAVAKHRGRGAWMTARREDYQWAVESFVPWVGRRLRGTSSGDGRVAKRPALSQLPPSE